MTKDDKEFFDKVMIAVLNGFVSQGEDARWEVADASDIAERALERRNVVLQELGYQEPPKAQPLPGIFGNLTVDGKPLAGKPFDTSPVITIPEVADHIHVGAGEATHWTLRNNSQMKIVDNETVVEPLSGEEYTKHGISVQKILSAVKSKKGRMMTASQVYAAAYQFDEPPTVNELRDIGRLLREKGYQIKRSGGKDLYQL